MAAALKPALTEIEAIRRADGESRSLAASMPRLVLEARRIAATVIAQLQARGRLSDEVPTTQPSSTRGESPC